MCEFDFLFTFSSFFVMMSGAEEQEGEFANKSGSLLCRQPLSLHVVNLFGMDLAARPKILALI
jgi:hypothetical protein